MRQDDVPPPVPERVGNPRIREDRAVQEFQLNSETMHRATSKDAYTKAWFVCEKDSTNVALYNVSTYHYSIPFKNTGSFNWRSEFRKVENMNKPVISEEKFNVNNDPQLSLLREF